MLVRVPDFDEVADELYGLPPDEFTAARTRYEKEAKAAGNREEAAHIRALAKPSVTAWLANQLAREHRAELEPLLELGAGLRDATRNLAGDQLRELSRQQSKLVYALVQQARQLARNAGRSVSEDVARGLDETLRAALADEEAGSLLLAGRLTDALQTSGFESAFGGSNGTGDAKVIPITSHKDSGGRRGASEDERLRAEQRLVDAQRALADATASLESAQAEATEVEAAAVAAQQRVEKLRQQLDELRQQLDEGRQRLDDASNAASDSERRRRDQAAVVQRAERAVQAAQRKAADAQDDRDRLAGRS
jgi:hypothetical protein